MDELVKRLKIIGDMGVVFMLIGAGIMYLVLTLSTPFTYEYNKNDGVLTFEVDGEIVSDYETIERNFDEDKGTKFKVYFEKE